MSEHTKEPWGINDQTGNGWLDNSIYVTGNDNIIRCYNDYGTAEANARRIVSCVNACAGVSTEWLESCDMHSGALFSLHHWAGHSDAMRKQRDKLLAAAKLVIEENGHLADGDVCTLKPLVDAIAEVEATK